MTELSPEAKKLLELARADFSPAEQRVDAVRSALELRIQLARGVGSSSGAGWTGWSGSHLVGIALVAIGLATAGVFFARKPPTESGAGQAPSTTQRATAPSSTVVPAAPSVTRNTPLQEPSPRESTARALDSRPSVRAAPLGLQQQIATVTATQPLARPAHAPVTVIAHEPRSSRSSGVRALSRVAGARASSSEPASVSDERGTSTVIAATPDTPAQTVAPSRDDSLAREIALLRNARAALDRHDPRAALAIADEHAAQFASGTMRQEQLATRVLALCALGRQAEAIAAKRELERIAPRSPHLMQIRSSCAHENVPEVK